MILPLTTDANIVAFGDSFTYGWHLPDQDSAHDYASNYAWPSVLANKLSCSVVNASRSGSSNREIWHRIINHSFNKNDVVCILWTWINRYAIIRGTNNADLDQLAINTPVSRRLGLALNNNNEFDRMYDSYTYIDHANRVLKERGITVYNFQVDGLENVPVWATATNMCTTRFVEIWSQYPYTSDNSHPGIESHNEMANIMLNFMQLDN